MFKPQIRFLNDLKNVLFDRTWAETAPNFRVYSVRRGVKFKDGLRYDETTISPRRLGQELPKTLGHEHPRDCVELMFVVKGEAVFLLQKDRGKTASDAYFVRARKGQAVVSPFGYSHVTINPTAKPLKIGTWMDDHCQSSYQTISELGGAGYFLTVGGWRKNKNYSRITQLREKKPLARIPKNLDFLKLGSLK